MASKTTKATQKANKTANATKNAKAPKNANATKNVPKNTKATKNATVTKNTKEPKNTKASKNTKEIKNAEIVDNEKPNVITRKFKCLYFNPIEEKVEMKGRYKGKKPKVSSSKAHTKLCKNFSDYYGDDERAFSMQECTRSKSKKKRYFYVGRREEIEKVVNDNGEEESNIVMKNDIEIPYKYKNIIRKMTKDDIAGKFAEAYEQLKSFDSKAQDNEDELIEKKEENKVKVAKKKATKKNTKNTKKNVKTNQKSKKD